ncbi:hypothetical protein A2U01_0011303, partial [Trifolium medium]|nr:hypothetical protein [Trifolium medium]
MVLVIFEEAEDITTLVYVATNKGHLRVDGRNEKTESEKREDREYKAYVEMDILNLAASGTSFEEFEAIEFEAYVEMDILKDRITFHIL